MIEITLDASLGSPFEVFRKELHLLDLSVVGNLLVDFRESIGESLLKCSAVKAVNHTLMIVRIDESGKSAFVFNYEGIYDLSEIIDDSLEVLWIDVLS